MYIQHTRNTRKFTVLLVVSILAILAIHSAFAATLNVDNSGVCDDVNGTPYCTIQAALNNASSDDTVSVANGVYNETLSILKDSITLTGQDRDGVVVDGAGNAYTILIEASDVLVSSLTMLNANAYNIHAFNATDLEITDVRSVGLGRFVNTSFGGHGGIDLNNVDESEVSNSIAEDHSKNGFSITASNNVTFSDITARDIGQSEGWAGLAVYTESGNPALSGNSTGNVLTGDNEFTSTPMGIYLEDFAGFVIGITFGSSVVFENQTVAPLVYLGLGNVTDVDQFAQDLGVPARLTGAVPGFFGAGYYKNSLDAYSAAALAPSTVTAVIHDLFDDSFFIGPGMTIQLALDQTVDGDRVFVDNGTYTENLVLNNEIRLHGTGYASTTIIDCSGGGIGVEVNADNTIVHDFAIIDCDQGVDINARSVTVKNNSFSGNQQGVQTNEGFENLITLNVFEGNAEFGILNNDINVTIDGTLNFWGSCDGPSGAGNGSGDNVSTSVDFDPWLGICIGDKSNVSCSFETSDASLAANVTAATTIQEVIFTYSINGTSFNGTGVLAGGDIYSFTIPTSQLVGGQDVLWNVLAFDGFGNNFTNGLQSFYVRNRSTLQVDPELPDGLQGWYVSEPVFTLTGDANNSGLFYQWDATPVIPYAGPFNLDDIPNAPPKESAGVLELNWFGDFGVCGNESEQTEIFTIDLQNTVVTQLAPENNSIVLNNVRPSISALLDEVFQSNSGVDENTITFTLDGVVETPVIVPTNDSLDRIINFTPTTDLTEGKHVVVVNVTDIVGRNTSTTWMFNISIVPDLVITVDSPVEVNYSTRRIPINVTTSKISKIEFINHNDRRPRLMRLCRNCDQYGADRKRTKTFADGDNNITIRATSIEGFVAEENVTFFVDSRPPRVSRTEPRRASHTNGSGFSVKYTEDNLMKVELVFNPTSELVNCTSGRNQVCTADVNLSAFDGQSIDYHFEVSDALHTVSSRSTQVFVDATAPILNITSPVSTTYGRRVPFNISITEEVSLEYMDLDASRPRFRRLCSRCNSYGDERLRTKSFRPGIRDIMIRATDKAGNTDTTIVHNVTS